MISIFISAISYLIIWIQQVFLNTKENPLFSAGNFIFLIGALLWPIYLYLYPTKYHTIILTLSISSLGVLLIFLQECIDNNSIGILFGLYLFCHVFFIDNVLWASSYRSLFPNSINGW